MTLYILFSIIILKLVQYPVLTRAYTQTESRRRKKQISWVLAASLLSDLFMLYVILSQLTSK